MIAKRFARFGLQIYAEKTRLVRCQRPPRQGRRSGRAGRDVRFPWLHRLLRSRRGHHGVLLKTAHSRFTRTLRALKQWRWAHRHLHLKEQQRVLREKLRDQDACYGVTGHHRMLHQLRWDAQRMWQRWLAGRNRGGGHNWAEFQARRRTFLLTPARVVHSRLLQSHPLRDRMR